MGLDLDAIARQVADAIQGGEWERAFSLVTDLMPAQRVTVKAKMLAEGAAEARVETFFGTLQVSGRSPSRVTKSARRARRRLRTS